MLRTDATAAGDGRPNAKSPRAEGALTGSRLGFERAASLRESLARYEADLDRWREQLASRAPHGRRWRSCLASGRETVADAGELYLRIRNEEHAALEALRTALAGMSGAGAEVVRLLEASLRLRESELRQLDETIQVTHHLLNLPSEASPDQVLFLLEDRARHLASGEARGRECDDLERRARELLEAVAAAETAPPIDDLGRALDRIVGVAESARSELDRLRAALAAAERRAEEAKVEVARLEAASRDRESLLRDARRERDEALALVMSLARRLGTPGLARPAPPA